MSTSTPPVGDKPADKPTDASTSPAIASNPPAPTSERQPLKCDICSKQIPAAADACPFCGYEPQEHMSDDRKTELGLKEA